MNKRDYKILGIEYTEDLSVVKKAYASTIANHHPEEDPEGWKKVHEAYISISKYLKSLNKPVKRPMPDLNCERDVQAKIHVKEEVSFVQSEPEFIIEDKGDKSFREPSAPEIPVIVNAKEKRTISEEAPRDDYKGLIDDLIEDSKNGKLSEEQEKEKNEKINDLINALRATSNGRTIETDKYLKLRENEYFTEAMASTRFVYFMTSFFQKNRFASALSDIVKEDIEKAAEYISVNRIETNIHYEELLKILESHKSIPTEGNRKWVNVNNPGAKVGISKANKRRASRNEPKRLGISVVAVSMILIMFGLLASNNNHNSQSYPKSYEQLKNDYSSLNYVERPVVSSEDMERMREAISNMQSEDFINKMYPSLSSSASPTVSPSPSSSPDMQDNMSVEDGEVSEVEASEIEASVDEIDVEGLKPEENPEVSGSEAQ